MDLTLSLDENGQASFEKEDPFISATDNCTPEADLRGPLISGNNNREFDCDDAGQDFIRTVVVRDAAGNRGTCDFTVSIVDDTPPEIECMDLTLSLDENGQASFVKEDPFISATDNCTPEADLRGPLIAGNNNREFDCDDAGQDFVRTVVVRDAAGNRGTCDFTVSIVDDTPPEIECMDLTLSLDENGQASFVKEDPFISATDNCTPEADLRGPLIAGNNNREFDCDDAGQDFVRTVVVRDAAGNRGTCDFTVSIVDDTPPEIECMDLTLSLDENGEASFVKEDPFVSATDNCTPEADLRGPLIAGNNNREFDCDDAGQDFIRTVVVRDAAGNRGTCDFTVSIVDDTPPEIECMDLTLSLDENGEASFVKEDPFVSATDNCTPEADLRGPLIAGNNNREFDCDDAGQDFVRTVVVRDAAGNRGSCDFTVSIVDDTPPEIECMDLTLSLDENGQASFVKEDPFVSATDNCTPEADLRGPLIAGNNNREFDCDDAGQDFVRTVVVRDAAGNRGSCDFTVSIVDDTPPEIECMDLTLYLDGNGEASFVKEDPFVSATDNCTPEADLSGPLIAGNNNREFDCDDAGQDFVRTVVVRDAAGNRGTCDFTVSIVNGPYSSCLYARDQKQDDNLGLDSYDLRSDISSESGLELSQNAPNPFFERTQISYSVDQTDVVRLRVMDLNGRLILNQQFEAQAGVNFIELSRSMLPSTASGVLIYTLETSDSMVSKKMTILR